MNRFAVSSILGVAAALISGCHGTATVTPRPVKLYSMNQGTLNTPMLCIGSVVALNPEKKTAFLLSAKTPDQSALNTTTVNQLNENYTGEFTLAFSANVPETVQGAVKAQATTNLELNIKNARISRVQDTAAYATTDERVKAAILEAHRQNANLKYFVVTQGTTAEDVSFTTKESASTSVDVKTVKVGVWTVAVSYSAGAVLKGSTGTGPDAVPLLIKVTPVKVQDGALAVDFSFPANELEQYKFLFAK